MLFICQWPMSGSQLHTMVFLPSESPRRILDDRRIVWIATGDSRYPPGEMPPIQGLESTGNHFPGFFHGFPRNSGKKAMGNSESRPIWRQDMAASAKDYWRLMSLKAPHGPAGDGNDGTTRPISQKMEKWTLYDYI